MTRKSEKQPSASWENVAEWYLGWSGRNGSAYHRRIAIPAVMHLLDVRPGQTILDVGCGPGALASHVIRASATYVGVDSSFSMIEAATRYHRHRRARFVHANAAGLCAALPHTGNRFDSVVCLLSIQDMDPIDRIVDEMAHTLRPGGRLVVFMTHPCFRIPRQSGWGWDARRKLKYRRVDRYLTPLAVPMEPYKRGNGHTKSYHRPLSVYVRAMATAGLTIDAMEEIPVDQKVIDRRRDGDTAMLSKEIPVFLCVRAVKAGRNPDEHDGTFRAFDVEIGQGVSTNEKASEREKRREARFQKGEKS